VIRRLVQQTIVRLDVDPLRRLFHAVYALGVRRVVASLSATPAVHSIYGCGSFFEDRCLHGHSDVDLVIVLAPQVARIEGGHHEVSRRYQRVRRLFPFLGRWDEKEGSLVFLEEVEAGFPLPDSFVLRLKQGRLHRLYGPELPLPLPTGPVDGYDATCEAATLLRVAIGTREDLARRLLFWKRLFVKLAGLADALGLGRTGEVLRAGPELGFLAEDDRTLFSRPADPERLFPALLDGVKALLSAIAEGEPPAREAWVDAQRRPWLPGETAVPTRIRSLVFSSGVDVRAFQAATSLPLGRRPEQFYFPLGGPTTVVDVGGSPYRALRRLVRTLRRVGAPNEALLVRIEGLLFVLSRQPTYVELVCLDPLRYADVYAHLRGESVWETPASVEAGLRAGAEQLFSALQQSYRRHDNWIPKAPFPCVYREEDHDTISTALSILRARLASSTERVCLDDAAALAAWYGRRYPAARPFFEDLLRYQRFLEGLEHDRPPAGNLFRCLHQFMAQALAGSETVELDDPRRRLGMTVGIVTRNRAGELAEALESLTRQSRVPEEVLVVDNGSSDGTKGVVEGFAGRLPVRYLYLEDASIPRARNMVLDQATQEVVAFTDDDAACERDWLSSIERGFLRAENVGLVGGWVEHWPHDAETVVDAYYERFHSSKG
jgi:Glycosyl transferase family 2